MSLLSFYSFLSFLLFQSEEEGKLRPFPQKPAGDGLQLLSQQSRQRLLPRGRQPSLPLRQSPQKLNAAKVDDIIQIPKGRRGDKIPGDPVDDQPLGDQPLSGQQNRDRKSVV